ncbi:MAG: FxsA family protein [Epsilonproteobacteria bacterium]|nr:MAG: FxsA family protein [Campylobacterota bacterium]
MIFIVVPFMIAELILSLKIIEMIGAMWSLAWIIGTIFIGITLLKNSQHAILGSLTAVSKGKLDLYNFQNASMAYMLGSILLIIPGILSDMIGVMALVYTFYLQLVAKITPEKPNFNQKGDDDVIDVEVIDEYNSSNRHA